MKIKLFDKQLRSEFYSILTAISVFTTIFLAVVDIPSTCKLLIGVSEVVLLIAIYIKMWVDANRLSSVRFEINSSPVEVTFGDIFLEDGLKVIAFNEFFDTLVDDVVISKRSLNGYFIEKYVPDIAALDEGIAADKRLQKKIVSEDNTRTYGKKTKYELCSIYQQEDYLLTAFTHFDKNNRAFLSIQDYINFLLAFWEEVDIVYAGRTVVIPLLGTGITRFRGYENILEQELLELLVWSFKVSRIRFQYPAKVKIIISQDKNDKINLFKLLHFYQNS